MTAIPSEEKVSPGKVCCVALSNPETGTNVLIPAPVKSKFPNPGGFVNVTTTSAVKVSSDASPVVPFELHAEILFRDITETVHVLIVTKTFAVS